MQKFGHVFVDISFSCIFELNSLKNYFWSTFSWSWTSVHSFELSSKYVFFFVSRVQMTKISKLTSWPRMTLTWPKVTESSKWCTGVLETHICRFMGNLCARYRYFGRESGHSWNHWNGPKFCLWPDLRRHRWGRSQWNFVFHDKSS